MHSHTQSRLSSVVTFASDASTTIPEAQVEDVEMGMLQHTSSSSEDRLEDPERPAISEPRRLRPMRVGQVSRKGNVLRKKNQCECRIVYGKRIMCLFIVYVQHGTYRKAVIAVIVRSIKRCANHLAR